MAYRPSLSDINIEQDQAGYQPSLSDIGINSQQQEPGKVSTFLGQLPDASQIKNLTPSQEDIKKAAGMILPLVAPEIRGIPLISNLLSKIPLGSAIGNTLGRIGYGTALTTAPDLMSEEGRSQLPERLKTNALMNTALEGLTMPFRALHGTAELFNPINYARGKAAQIKNEHDAAKAVMEENYKPINEAYGNFPVSVTPENYLKKSGINKDNLYADAQNYYNDFVKEPTYKNLLNLKGQIGRDWAKISPSDQVRDTQLFNRYRNTLDDKLKNFLSRDPEMLNQYNAANKYAENVFYPYLSTPTLQRISKGKFDTIYPKKMADSLENATQRVVGQEYKYRIPEGHALRNHLKDLQNRLTVGEISELTIPSLVGGIAGELLHPGLGGVASGLTGGIGSSIGSNLLRSKLLRYPVVQSPIVQNVFSKAASPFYGTGRAAISAYDQNQ